MARVQDAELARLKLDVSLVRLIEAGGIELKRQGKDYACRCPFHEEIRDNPATGNGLPG